MTGQHKKQLRNHAIQIVLGILIIIPFANDSSWLRFIALGGFLLIMYNIIWFVRNSEELLYLIFPTKSIREIKPKRRDKIWGHISIVLFITGLVFMIIQMNNIEAFIEEPSFWKKFGLIGFLFSLLCLLILYKFQPSIFHESGRRYSVVFGFILGFTALTIATFSYLNKEYAKTETTESIHTIGRKSTGGKKGNSHWVFIIINESDKRFQLQPDLWNNLNAGDAVLLKIQHGYLGYDFVSEIRPLEHVEDY